MTLYDRGAWVGEKNKGYPDNWIAVDLGKPFNVTAVQTQGRNKISQWIEKFTLQYRNEGTDWTSYSDHDDNDKVLLIDILHIYNYLIFF